MSKRLGLIVAILFSLFFGQVAFAATITQEFTFETAPNETVKTWEINIPFPENETGKFIGRDFKPIVNDTEAELIVEKETFSDKNYSAKGRLIGLASGTPQPVVSGKLQINLTIGETPILDTPQIPSKVALKKFPLPIELEWLGLGDEGKTLPISAKYLYYQIKDGTTGALLTEQIVPVYLVGFRFPINHEPKKGFKYQLMVQLSNVSGKYSKPVNVIFESSKKVER